MVERFEIGRGLAVPIDGEPEQKIDAKEVSRVAIVADDYIGMRPTLLVSEGDRVEVGQPLFSDKKTEGVLFTSPAGGTVQSINRGEKRRFLSLVIDKSGSQESRSFASHDVGQNCGARSIRSRRATDRIGAVDQSQDAPLQQSSAPGSAPQAIFVNAMDTNPLAAAPGPIVADSVEDFKAGLDVLARLTDGNVYVCRAPKSEVPGESHAQG